MSSKTNKGESFVLYASGKAVVDFKCFVVAEAQGVSFTSGTGAVEAPFLPALVHRGQVIFGASAICLYLALMKNKPEADIFSEVLEIEEGLLSKDKECLKASLIALIAAVEAAPVSTEYMSRTFLSHVCHAALSAAASRLELATQDPLVTRIAALAPEAALVVQAQEKMQVAFAASAPKQMNIAAEGLAACLKSLFSSAIAAAYPALSPALQEASIARCANPKFGDFQCNSAMALSKELKALGQTEAPRDVGAKIAASLPGNSLVASCSTAPNGFINIFISTDTLVSTVAQLASRGLQPPEMQARKILVDFSSPNIAKEMHVGHLRSTIIGDSVCRLLEFCGHEVLRVNHVGDWGTQFGMLISYFEDEYPDLLTSPPNISDLTVIYKAAKVRFDESETFKERSRLNVVKLQSGDEKCRLIWTLICDISRLEFQKVYDILDIQLTEVGESFYNPYIPATIEELQKLGLIYNEEKLLLIKLPHFEFPLILRKSDGGYGYDSTDMAAIKYRLQTLARDWVVYITDAGQASHFHKIFDAARAAQWVPTQRLDHIGFGVVCGDDGKRIKTRSGESVRLIDLLNAAKDRMRESLVARAAEKKTSLAEDEIEYASKAIGYGAVKYFDLKQHPSTNYVFNYDRMLDTKGDTAVYLLFAYARLASILRKGRDAGVVSAEGEDVQELVKRVSIAHPAERALAFELLQFGEVVRGCVNDLLPSRLCDYLKELCVKFTDFVTKCQVLNSEECGSRLVLCEATRKTMARCFDLLGIKTLERI